MDSVGVKRCPCAGEASFSCAGHLFTWCLDGGQLQSALDCALDRRRGELERHARERAKVHTVSADDQVDLSLGEADHGAVLAGLFVEQGRLASGRPAVAVALLDGGELLDGRLAVDHAVAEHDVAAFADLEGGGDVVELEVLGHRDALVPDRRLAGLAEVGDGLDAHVHAVVAVALDAHQGVTAQDGVADLDVAFEGHGELEHGGLDAVIQQPREGLAETTRTDKQKLIQVARTGHEAILGEDHVEELLAEGLQSGVAREELTGDDGLDAVLEGGQKVETGPVLAETTRDRLDDLRRNLLLLGLDEVALVVIGDVDDSGHLAVAANRGGDEGLLVVQIAIDVRDDVIGKTDDQHDAEGGGETERSL